MKHDNLEVAQRHLSAAYEALVTELLTARDTWTLCDAANLTADALTQLEGEIAHRADARPLRGRYLGGASA